MAYSDVTKVKSKHVVGEYGMRISVRPVLHSAHLYKQVYKSKYKS